MKLCHLVIITLKHGAEKPRQKQPFAKFQIPHNAKINRHQNAIITDENITRMHIGMKIAVTKHLIEKAAGGNFGHFCNIMPGGAQTSHIINADAVDPFDDQHATGAVFKIDPRHIDSGIIRQIIFQPPASGGFQPEIKFGV